MKYYSLRVLIFFNFCVILHITSSVQSKSLFVSTKRLSIFIQNNLRKNILIWDPLSSNSRVVTHDWGASILTDPNMNIKYVHNAVLEEYSNEDKWILAMIGEDTFHKKYFIVYELEIEVLRTFRTTCVLYRELEVIYELHPFPIGIHPNGRYTCVVGLLSTICFDLKEKQITNYSNSLFWKEGTYIFGQSLVITSDDRLFLLAYCLIELDNQKDLEKVVLNLLSIDLTNLSNPILLDLTKLSVEISPNEYFLDSKKYSLLSLSIDDQSKRIIVGIAYVNQVLILSALNRFQPAKIIKEHYSTESVAYFGKSVLMLDEDRYAVLIPSMLSPQLGCSSQVQFFSLSDEETKSKPIFVFPNNQQIIETKLNQWSIPSILSLSKWNVNGIGLVLDTSIAILISESSPGYYSGRIDTLAYANTQIYQSIICQSGTYQKEKSIGPCLICPSATKSKVNMRDQCEKCVETNTSICFPGSSNETYISEMMINDELEPYPESPDSTQFEDILLYNLLTLSTKSLNCFIRSPIFMASLTLVLLTIIYISMRFILFNNSKYKKSQIFFGKIFGHFDLITEKEHCFGGLMTLSLLIIIICAWIFSASYSHMYPIERITNDDQQSISCHCSLINAKFSSSLQLISIRKHPDERPMFDLLEKQPILLNIQLISTHFQCRHLLIEENRGQGLSIPWSDFNCSENKNSLNISIVLPQKSVTMQFDLHGPHVIGGLYVCLLAPSLIINQGKYVASQMKHCQFYFNRNETLSSNPIVNIKMAKAINRTISRTLLDNDTYSGTWLPIFSWKSFNDQLLFVQKGEYYRYLTSKTSLIIDISESEFYVRNTQEPIARTHEIIFTTILFSTLCLELVALFFTVFRLIIVPFFYLIKKRFFARDTFES